MPIYTKTIWINDSSPDIDQTNLNNIESGIENLYHEFDANTILIANVVNTPIKLSVAASTFLGRAAADGIAAMTVAAAKTLLAIGIADISDIPGTIASILTDHDKAAHDALNIDADTVDGEEASAIVTLARISALVPSLDATGKLILTGATQIGTKATDLAALWDKTTKIVKADIDSGEFDVASKIPSLDASVFLALSQIVGNVPSLDANGKLVLTGSGQIGTKTADLVELWSKGTLIDDSMIGLNELHAEGASSFAGPGGVTVTHSLNLANYAPHIIPTADGAGAIGEIWVTDIAVNSFVVRNSGSGVTGFTWVIHNRT